MSGGAINPTELVATLINQEATFEDGLEHALAAIEGSCSILLLTDQGIYAARDRLGRTPVIIGKKEGAFAVTFETCAFPNLGYEVEHELGPGEVVAGHRKRLRAEKGAGQAASDLRLLMGLLWLSGFIL